MRSQRVRLLAVLVATGVAVGLIGWLALGSDEDGPQPQLELVQLELGSTGFTLTAELADDREERIRGLSGRESLPAERGMLFANQEDVDTAFTMRNTLIPLSVAFLDADGTVLEILDLTPCTDEPCPTYEPSQPYRLALEVNQGAFGRWGIGPGDTIRAVEQP